MFFEALHLFGNRFHGQPQRGGNGLLGEIVIRRPKPAGEDNHIRTLYRLMNDGGEPLAGGFACGGDTPLAQDDSCRLGQGERQVGGEGAVREAPHTVRPEQRHRI